MTEGRLISGIYKCVDCGGDFPRKELNRKFRCQDCAMIALQDNMHALLNKHGAYYEKWKQSIRAAADKL